MLKKISVLNTLSLNKYPKLFKIRTVGRKNIGGEVLFIYFKLHGFDIQIVMRKQIKVLIKNCIIKNTKVSHTPSILVQ